MRRRYVRYWLLLVAPIALAASCPRIAPFSPVAYQQAVSLKVASLALMERATEPYAAHEREVADLVMRLTEAYEYARGRPDNEISTRQWEILMDSTRNLLGGFLARWRREGTLGQLFVREAGGLVSDAFDTIIGLESGKIRRSDVPQ